MYHAEISAHGKRANVQRARAWPEINRFNGHVFRNYFRSLLTVSTATATTSGFDKGICLNPTATAKRLVRAIWFPLLHAASFLTAGI